MAGIGVGISRRRRSARKPPREMTRSMNTNCLKTAGEPASRRMTRSRKARPMKNAAVAAVRPAAATMASPRGSRTGLHRWREPRLIGINRIRTGNRARRTTKARSASIAARSAMAYTGMAKIDGSRLSATGGCATRSVGADAGADSSGRALTTPGVRWSWNAIGVTTLATASSTKRCRNQPGNLFFSHAQLSLSAVRFINPLQVELFCGTFVLLHIYRIICWHTTALILPTPLHHYSPHKDSTRYDLG